MISCISPEAATEVRDLILKPPANPYTKLKETLISRTSESAAQRIKKALDATEFGDMRPTQILRLLEQQLDGMEPNQTLLTQVFLQKLPGTVRSIVAANSDKITIAELAELADRVYENLPSTSMINKVSKDAPTCSCTDTASKGSSIDDRMSRLESMLEKLLDNDQCARDNDRPNHVQRRFRSKSRSKFNPEGSLCYFHWRYRDNAKKCTSPCKWQDSSNRSSKN